MSDSSVPPPPGEITLLLGQIEPGERPAAERLLRLVYEELRKLAAAKMARESAGMTLQPTALVHEAWLRLGADDQPNWQNRAQFFAAAAEAMRRILIERARKRRAVRHGGDLQRVTTDAAPLEVISPATDEKLLLVNEALERLAVRDPRKAELVKHRYFVGLTLEETAAAMGISERTAKREWSYARAWLLAEIKTLRS
jgi:RNA polymerase sigma factor (TIGR02999 family)